MPKFIIVIILSLVITGLGSAEFQAAFNDKLIGTRAIGLAGAYTAIADHPTAIIWNPAGLAQSENKLYTSFEYANKLDFFDYYFFGISYKLTDDFSFGSGVLHSGDEIYSESTYFVTVSKSIHDNLSLIKPLQLLSDLSMGMNLKIFHASFGDNSAYFFDYLDLNHHVSGKALGYGLDLGLLMDIDTRNHVGLMFKNIYSSIEWDSINEAGSAKGKYKENLPFQPTLGYSGNYKNYFWSIDLTKALHSDDQDYIAAGLEYKAYEDILVLRAGYSQELVTLENQRLSLGLSINHNIGKNMNIALDLAYENSLAWEKHNSSFIGLTISR